MHGPQQDTQICTLESLWCSCPHNLSCLCMQVFAEEIWQKVGAHCIAAGVGPGTSLRLASTTELHLLLFLMCLHSDGSVIEHLPRILQ